VAAAVVMDLGREREGTGAFSPTTTRLRAGTWITIPTQTLATPTS